MTQAEKTELFCYFSHRSERERELTNKYIDDKIKTAMCEANSNAVLGEGWHRSEDIPEYFKPIIMFIETKVLGSTHELYIAGYYHTDGVWLESCGGNMDQEFNNYKFNNYRLKAWAYIQRPAFV